MSQVVIKNESDDKNQNETCRSKQRRPDKQLYVPRAKREAQHNNTDVIIKLEPKSEAMSQNSLEQSSSIDSKPVHTSPIPSVKNRRNKKKTIDKHLDKLQNDLVDSEKPELKNNGKNKTCLKIRKRNGNANKLKVQSSAVLNKPNDNITPISNENDDNKESNRLKVQSSAILNNPNDKITPISNENDDNKEYYRLKVQSSAALNNPNDKITPIPNENDDNKEPLHIETIFDPQCQISIPEIQDVQEVKCELYYKEEIQPDTCKIEVTLLETTVNASERTSDSASSSVECSSDLNSDWGHSAEYEAEPDHPSLTEYNNLLSAAKCEKNNPCHVCLTAVDNFQDQQDLNRLETHTTNSSVPPKESETTQEKKKSVDESNIIPGLQAAQIAKIDVININAEETPQRNNSNSDKGDLTWEAMYDDEGECLHPEFVKELTETIGQVKIEKAKLNYTQFQPREPVINDGEFSHVIEIYDFPAEFKTADLMTAFSQFRNRGFDIKWVDDTHALGLFASSIAATDALAISMPFMKTRPLSEASRESKLKARRCAEFLQPYRPRPETSASLARRLVGGALGLQVHVSKEQREKERQKLKDAKEKKRHAAKIKNEIWEGAIPNSLAEVT